MKIETGLNELYNKGICNEDNVEAIRDVMEELSNEFYHLGYEDGRIDFDVGDGTFTAYGKKGDFEKWDVKNWIRIFEVFWGKSWQYCD